MNLKICYFGMVAETTNCNEEILTVDKECCIDQLKIILKNKYQKLQNLSFIIAIDKEIALNNQLLNPNNEVALLPPFSGG